jgi:hypothetical protein
MTTHERVRQIFLRPQQAYGLTDAANLLEYSYEQIIAAVEQGDLSVESHGDIPRVPWEEVALAAAERWPQDLIEDALGSDAESVMPELVRLTDLHARVPRYGVIVLGRIAQREGTTVNQVLARQLLDLAVAEAEALETSISGLGPAMRWPVV